MEGYNDRWWWNESETWDEIPVAGNMQEIY